MAEKQKKYVCDFMNCRSKFSKPSKLEIHKRVHTGEKPFKCDEKDCNKSYTSSSHLKRHIQSSHNCVKEKVLCSKCNLLFASLLNLKKHDSRVHNSDQKIYSCDDCSKGFKKKHLLTEHRYLHTGIVPFKCEKCEMSFLSLSLYKKHCRNHVQRKCECGVVCETWTILVAHRKLSHDKYFFCDVCGRNFLYKMHLKQHKKVHFNLKTVFECSEENCSKYYSYKRNLTQHIKVVHEGKKLPCTYEDCEIKFTSRKALDYHLTLHKKMLIKKTKKREKKTAKKVPVKMCEKLSGLSGNITYNMERKLLNELSNKAL